MQRIYADQEQVGLDFTAILGDIVSYGNGLREARNSARPVFFVQGDHDCFEEWGHRCEDDRILRSFENDFTRSLPAQVPPLRRRTLNQPGHKGNLFGMMLGELPNGEAWSGLPYSWSLTLRGIHLVFMQSDKLLPMQPFALAWFKRDLAEHRAETTVIFTHRNVFETGNRWSREWNETIAASPQVKLVLYGHYHYAPVPMTRPFARIGSALALATELVPDIPAGRKPDDLLHKLGAYPLFAIDQAGLQVWMRYPDEARRPPGCPADGLLPVVQERFASSLDDTAARTVSLPYLMAKGQRHFLPAVQLRKATLRLGGVAREQLLPDPQLAGPIMPWQGPGTQALSAVAEANPLGIARMVQAAVGARTASEQAPATILTRDIDLGLHQPAGAPLWNQAEGQWDFSGGKFYVYLGLLKAPPGRNVWTRLELLAADGSVESAVVRRNTGAGRDQLTYAFEELECGWVRSQRTWVAWGLDPKDGVEREVRRKGPLTARTLRVTVQTPDTIAVPEEWFYTAYLYTTPHYYTIPLLGRSVDNPAGRDLTRDLVVTVGARKVAAGSALQDEQTSAVVELGDLLGGTPFAVEDCAGSGLAVVELRGELDALMGNVPRQITALPEGGFRCGELCEAADSNNPAKGVCRVNLLRPGLVDDRRVDHKSAGTAFAPAIGTRLVFPGP